MSRIDELIDRYCPDGVEYKKLGEVAEIKPGRDYKHFETGDIPVYGSGGIMTYVDEAAYCGPSVLLPRKGSISNVFYVDGPFWNVDTIYYT
jgi:type I restriction enzyme S subunit